MSPGNSFHRWRKDLWRRLAGGRKRAKDGKNENANALAAGLLPAGLADVLPPQAEFEAQVTEALLGVFAGFGYERVEPPLIEFETTLTAGPGQALAEQMLRLMDPLSQRMMGLRTDITLQVARIARTRLRDAPRPLRLSYAGEVLRVRGAQLRPERQFAQAGAELIGVDAAGADCEIVLLGAEALTALGLADFSVDLTHPLLAPAAAKALGLPPDAVATARLALDRKDAAALSAIAGTAAGKLGALLRASGPAEDAISKLAALRLPEPAAGMARELGELVAALRAARPDLKVTVDPCEFRGFEYHTGISFSFFARNVRGELAGGGRYMAGANDSDAGEPATGLTVYMETVMRGLAPAAARPSVFLPFGAAYADGAKLRAENWATVQGLAKVSDSAAEARRLGCTHLFEHGKINKLAG